VNQPHIYLTPEGIFDLIRDWPAPLGWRLVTTFDPGIGVVMIEAVRDLDDCLDDDSDPDDVQDTPFAVLALDRATAEELAADLIRLLREAVEGGVREPLTVGEIIEMGRWS
jgi:hypothetical protein